ncbi:ribulose-phosphate 3-epimerase [Spirochaeta dissipatitropha]
MRIIMYSIDMGVSTIRIAPSILSADFTRIAHAVSVIEKSGADWIHLDVMDGHFVPNLTFGSQMISHIRKESTMPLDVHLMIEKPELSVPLYIDAGADHITFHIEACTHAHRTLQIIKNAGLKAGISIVPSSPVSLITPLLEEIDIVLLMSVNPGFGGQTFIPYTMEKIRQLSDFRKLNGVNFDIVIDGGVHLQNSAKIAAAGADVLVSGSAFFAASNQAEFVDSLKSGDNGLSIT